MTAIRQNGLALRYTSDIDWGLCWLAVKQDGNALEFIPDQFKVFAIYYRAILTTPEAIQFIPSSLIPAIQTALLAETLNELHKIKAQLK